MNKVRQVLVLGFAVFAGFFGAGNLILPPYLGLQSGGDWWLSALGFLLSATLIPMLALFGHARLQGTMLDFGNKVSKRFSLFLCVCIYVIAITLPCPRTAAVTHEMSVAPYFDTSSLLTSGVYFGLALIFALQRGRVMEIMGKFLTPVIVLILLSIIVIATFQPAGEMASGIYPDPVIKGFLEGYQTYDAIAGLLYGGVLVLAVDKVVSPGDQRQRQRMILMASMIAMAGLVMIYSGLIYIGARNSGDLPADLSRTALLSELSLGTLGNSGGAFLSVLVALACFTTAVGIIVGTSDFFKGLYGNSEKAYRITAVVCCILGVLMGQLDVKYIIQVAIPVLLFIYPISMVLIFLNLLPKKYAGAQVFRAVVVVAFLFSLPDIFKFFFKEGFLPSFYDNVPYADSGLVWVLPALVTFLAVNAKKRFKTKPLND